MVPPKVLSYVGLAIGGALAAIAWVATNDPAVAPTAHIIIAILTPIVTFLLPSPLTGKVKSLAILPLVALCGCLSIATDAQIATATVADVVCGQAIDTAATSGESVAAIISDPTVDAACVTALKDSGLAIADFVIDILASSKSATPAATEARLIKAARR
jgi:hypothetical protein